MHLLLACRAATARAGRPGGSPRGVAGEAFEALPVRRPAGRPVSQPHSLRSHRLTAIVYWARCLHYSIIFEPWLSCLPTSTGQPSGTGHLALASCYGISSTSSSMLVFRSEQDACWSPPLLFRSCYKQDGAIISVEDDKAIIWCRACVTNPSVQGQS